MFEFIIKYWVEFAFSLLLSTMGFIYKKVGDYADEQKAIKSGIKAILYDQITSKCKENLNKGYLTLEELEDIKRSSNTYKELGGGNGAVHIMIERVSMLPIKEEN